MRLAILFLILIFLINTLFIAYDLGTPGRGFNIDPFLHFSGGFFVAMFFGSYFKNLRIGNSGNPKFKKILIIVSATIFVGVIWEFSEYLGTTFFGNYLYEKYRIICCIGNLDDTINDLAMDVLGSITFVLAFLIPLKSKYRCL